jgi:hypothetical protein
MNRALADDALRSKLGEFRVETEFYDKDGKVLGVFTPAITGDRASYDHIASLISDEELERRRKEPGGKTTAELLHYLQSL